MVVIIVAFHAIMVGSAQAEAIAEVKGLNETAFWAFVTVAVTVVVSVIITGIFHYLSTRELRKMGTEMAVETVKLEGKVHEDVSEDIKLSSEQMQRRIVEDGRETRKTASELILRDGEETRKAMVELGKSVSARNIEDCDYKTPCTNLRLAKRNNLSKSSLRNRAYTCPVTFSCF